MNVTNFSVVNVHVDELSFARIWQHKLCATFSANVNINYRLAIKVYYRICTLRHIRIEIIHGSQNVFLKYCIPQSCVKSLSYDDGDHRFLIDSTPLAKEWTDILRFFHCGPFPNVLWDFGKSVLIQGRNYH